MFIISANSVGLKFGIINFEILKMFVCTLQPTTVFSQNLKMFKHSTINDASVGIC